MQQPQLYKLIGIPIIIGLIITGIIFFLASATTKYDVTGYDNETKELLLNLEEQGKQFDSITDGVDKETTELGSEEAEADKEGNLLTKGYQAVKTTSNSYILFDSLLDKSLERMRLGAYGNSLKIALGSLIGLVFVLGITLLIIFRVRV